MPREPGIGWAPSLSQPWPQRRIQFALGGSGWVPFRAVACLSGLNSMPRKRVRRESSEGSNPSATATPPPRRDQRTVAVGVDVRGPGETWASFGTAAGGSLRLMQARSEPRLYEEGHRWSVMSIGDRKHALAGFQHRQPGLACDQLPHNA